MILRNAFAVGAALLVLAACESTTDLKTTEESGGRMLTGAELTERYKAPVRMTWNNASGNSGTSDIRPDGTLTVDWGGGSDEGEWRIIGDTVCNKYKKVRDGEETCFVQFEMPDGSFRQYEAETKKYNATFQYL